MAAGAKTNQGGRPPVYAAAFSAAAQERPDLRRRAVENLVYARFAARALAAEPASWVKDSPSVMAELGRLEDADAVALARQLAHAEPRPTVKAAVAQVKRLRGAARPVTDPVAAVHDVVLKAIMAYGERAKAEQGRHGRRRAPRPRHRREVARVTDRWHRRSTGNGYQSGAPGPSPRTLYGGASTGESPLLRPARKPARRGVPSPLPSPLHAATCRAGQRRDQGRDSGVTSSVTDA